MESLSEIYFKSKVPINYEESIDPKMVDFTQVAVKVLTSKADLVGVVGFGQWIGGLLKKLREQGYKGEIHASAGFMLTDAYLTAGEAAKGIWYNDLKVDTENSEFISIKEDFERRYGEHRRFSMISLLFYDWISLIRLAAVSGNATRDKLIPFIRHLQFFDCPFMKVEVTEDGEIIVPMVRRRFE